MNRKSVNTCLTDMINISIESVKLLLNEINQIENKNSFIIIREGLLCAFERRTLQKRQVLGMQRNFKFGRAWSDFTGAG